MNLTEMQRKSSLALLRNLLAGYGGEMRRADAWKATREWFRREAVFNGWVETMASNGELVVESRPRKDKAPEEWLVQRT